ncbi:hypothetical protein CR513_35878, partial [Mucuna pruriens]
MWNTLALAYEGTSQLAKKVETASHCLKNIQILKKLPMEKLPGTLKVHEIELKENERQRKGKFIILSNNCPKPLKLRNPLMKPHKMKALMKTSYHSSLERLIPCGKIKEVQDGETTPRRKGKENEICLQKEEELSFISRKIIPCGKIKEVQDGETTPRRFIKKINTRCKWCSTNAKSQDTSYYNVQILKMKRKRKINFSSKRRRYIINL